MIPHFIPLKLGDVILVKVPKMTMLQDDIKESISSFTFLKLLIFLIHVHIADHYFEDNLGSLKESPFYLKVRPFKL